MGSYLGDGYIKCGLGGKYTISVLKSISSPSLSPQNLFERLHCPPNFVPTPVSAAMEALKNLISNPPEDETKRRELCEAARELYMSLETPFDAMHRLFWSVRNPWPYHACPKYRAGYCDMDERLTKPPTPSANNSLSCKSVLTSLSSASYPQNPIATGPSPT